jgi:hypothetical protein
MTVKLTDRFLTSRKAPPTGRAIYTDATVPGLAFRVSATTTSNPEQRRDWLLRYRPRRQSQKGRCTRRLSRHLPVKRSAEGRGDHRRRQARDRLDSA